MYNSSISFFASVALLGVSLSSPALAGAATTICFPNSTTTAANDVLVLSASNPEDWAMSTGSGLCSGYYVADFRLYPSADYVDIYGINEDGDALVEGSSMADCDDMNVSVMFFSKTSTATKWTAEGVGSLHGAWLVGDDGWHVCRLILDSGIDSVEAAPPSKGTMTWRVAVRNYTSGGVQIVGAEATLPPVPPS